LVPNFKSLTFKFCCAAIAVLVIAGSSCNQRQAQFAGNSIEAKAAVVVDDESFKAGLINQAITNYKPAFGLIQDELTLKEQPPVKLTFKQVARKPISESFTQGHPGSVTIKDYAISSSAELDLLVVVDNSSSMAAVQAMLAVGMRDFIGNLQSVDWQIGIITSDNPSNPNLLNADGCQLYGTNGRPGGQPIRKGDPDATSKFLSTIINIGARGSDNEESILNSYKHLTGTCAYGNNQWLRPNALLGIVFVTDEDSYCPEPIDPVTGLPTRPKDFDSELCTQGQRPSDLIRILTPPQRPEGMARVYSLTWRPDDMQCYSNAQRPANRVLEVMNAVGGFDNSICQDNYSATLQAIATDAARVVRRQFQLPNIPILDSVHVTIDGVPSTDFIIEGSVLTLTRVTAAQTTLHISYRHDPVPIFSSITLSEKADPKTLEVVVNGSVLNATEFSYDRTTGSIQFEEAPANYAHIAVEYRTDGILKRSFDVGAISMSPAPVKVTINGQAIDDFVLDPSTHSLEFSTPPPDDAEITFSYVRSDAKILRYAAIEGPAGAKPYAVTVLDKDTNEPLAATVSGAEIVFDESDVKHDRHVIVTYNYGDGTTLLTHDLAYEPLLDSVQLKDESGGGDCFKNIVVTGKQVSYRCDAQSLGNVSIDYKYVEQHYETFTLVKQIPQNGIIQVYVDGAANFNFQVDGQTVRVPKSETTPQSTVRVVVLARL
jgi:hypothetical protein